MFSERSYARERYPYNRPGTSVLVWLLCALGAGFIIQTVFESLIPGAQMFPAHAAAMSAEALRGGHVWKLFSYVFLHGSFLHLLFNGIMIYFMGSEVLALIGSKRFVGFCAAAAAGGALLWFGVNFHRGGTILIGASSISLALLILYACFYPDTKITLLLFFIIPVPVRPKYVAIAAAAMDVCGLFLSEIPGRVTTISVAYSAHIGGMVVAVLYFFLVHKREWLTPDVQAEPNPLTKLFRKKEKPAAVVSPKYKVNITTRDDLRAEVDRILDKINSQGFASLTDEEKRTLDGAKDLLSGL